MRISCSCLCQNLSVLNKGGRLVEYGTMGGVITEIDLRSLMRNMCSVIGTTLRGRSLEYKVGKEGMFSCHSNVAGAIPSCITLVC